MKKKEIITIIISLVVMGASIFYMLQLLFPPDQNQTVEKESEKVPQVNTELDENTYKRVEDLSDYGLPGLDDIGKSDIFRVN
jgi:hypothetical protein